MSAAAADIFRQRVLDLSERRMRRLAQQRLRRHDHPVCAVTALRGLLGNEGGLKRIRVFRSAQSFDRRDRAIRNLIDRRKAGARRFSFHQYGAGTALAKSTAKPRAMQAQAITQQVQQWLLGIPGIQRHRFAVDSERVFGHSFESRQIVSLWHLDFRRRIPFGQNIHAARL